MSWANEGLSCPGLWRHRSGEAGAPGRHAADRLLPKEESIQSGGGGNARGREKDALSQGPWAHKSKPHEARQWEPWTPHLESSVTQARLLLKPVQVCDHADKLSAGNGDDGLCFRRATCVVFTISLGERLLLPVTKGFLIPLALSLEMGPSKSWERISAIKCFHLQDTWACNSTQNASCQQSIKWKLTHERIPHPVSPGRCEKQKQDKLWPYVHFPSLT